MNIKSNSQTSKEAVSSNESKSLLTRRAFLKGLFVTGIVALLPACVKNGVDTSPTRVPVAPIKRTIRPDIELNNSQNNHEDDSQITETPLQNVNNKEIVTSTPVAKSGDQGSLTNAGDVSTGEPILTERQEFENITENSISGAENVFVERNFNTKIIFSLFVSGIEEKQPNLADSEKTSIMKIVRKIASTANIAYMGIQSGDFLKMLPFNAIGKYKDSMKKALNFAFDARKRVKLTTFSAGVFSLFVDINLLRRVEPNIDIFAPALKGFLKDDNLGSSFGSFLGGFATKEDFFNRVNELDQSMSSDKESPRKLMITIRVGRDDPIVDYDKVKAGIEEALTKGVINRGVVILEQVMESIKHSPDQRILEDVLLNRVK